jgi:hypothetical protein
MPQGGVFSACRRRHLSGARAKTEEAVARPSPLRGTAACALLAITSFVATIASAADGASWLADRALAAQKAAEQGKLLLVIDLGGDFLTDERTSAEARTYRSLAMSDRRVADLLASRFIVTFRTVGPSASLQSVVPAPPSGDRKTKVQPRLNFPSGEVPSRPSDFALGFVCTPSQRVLHFIPGLVSADALLAELTWAEACNRDRLRASPDEQEGAVRQRHLAAAAGAQRKTFLERFPTKWDDTTKASAGKTPIDLAAAIAAAKNVRDRELVVRLKLNSSLSEEPMLAALAAHGELEPTLAHLVLAEFPLPKLSDIERRLYEIGLGQRFWQSSSARELLVAWWSEARKGMTPTLLIVRDDPFYAGTLGDGERLVWPPPLGFRMTSRLRAFDSKVVTLDELAMLLADAGLEPIRFTAGQSPPRYVIHDRAGFRLAQISARDGTYQRLATALRGNNDSGELAAATRGEGETTDEDK